MISADAIRGYVDLMVLSIIRKRPSYAYELSQTISEIGAGDYVVKQTTVYSAVKRMESAGLVESSARLSESGKSRTYYAITSLGEAHLRHKVAEWEITREVVDRFVKGID